MVHFLFFWLLISVTSTSWIPRVLPLSVFASMPYASPNTWNITARQYLNASQFHLVMQPDCNLVTYNGSTPFLTTNLTANSPVGPPNTWSCYATFQADGNFVVYQSNNNSYKTALWSSDTYTDGFNNSNYRYLVLGEDGSLSLHEPDGTPLTLQSPFIPVTKDMSLAPSNLTFSPELEWKPTESLDGYPFLPPEYFLSQGSKLQTSDGRFELVLGQDCKLQSQERWTQNGTVKRVIWDPQGSMPGVATPCQLTLQQDGLVEVRDNASGVVYWNSRVSGEEASVNWVLKVDADDGHVGVSDISNSTNVIWTSIVAELQPGNRAVRIWPLVVGVIGGVFFLAMAAFGLWYFCFRPSFLSPNEKAFQQRLLSIGGRCQVLSEAKIKQATNNFVCRIGYGGFGDVFYGKLEDGQEIAAKVLSSASHQSKEEFYNEIELLSVVHYKYLVTLIGYSFTPHHQILVYEFMSGGDLRHRLSQGSDGAGNGCAGNAVAGLSPLRWRERTSITLQVAEGIEYLHEKCTPAIIHRDIKSNNILLTNDLVVKVADFGLSKLRTIDQENATHITTLVKGTPGYLDPEYHKTGLLTEKSDVYAFGIVLMEILTGQQQMHIAERVFEARRSGNLEGLRDPHLLQGDYDRDEFVDLVDLSLWCVRKSSGNRPFIRQVVQRLREIVVAPLESSAQPKVIESKGGDDKHVRELENSKEVASSDVTAPFSGSFSTGDIKSETWRLDQFGDSSLSQMLDHSSSQSSAGNPETS